MSAGVIAAHYVADEAPPILSAPIVVNATTGRAATGTATVPAGTTAGDLRVLFASVFNGTCATPDGWTLVDFMQPFGTQGLYVFAKTAGAAETSTPLSITGVGVGWTSVTIRGHRSGSPFEGTAGKATSGELSTTLEVVGPTTAIGDCLLLGCVSTYTSGQSRSLVSWSPAGASVIATINTINGAHVAKAVKPVGPADVTTFTLNGTNNSKAGIVLAVAPGA